MTILTTYFTVSCLFTFVSEEKMYVEFNRKWVLLHLQFYILDFSELC